MIRWGKFVITSICKAEHLGYSQPFKNLNHVTPPQYSQMTWHTQTHYNLYHPNLKLCIGAELKSWHSLSFLEIDALNFCKACEKGPHSKVIWYMEDSQYPKFSKSYPRRWKKPQTMDPALIRTKLSCARCRKNAIIDFRITESNSISWNLISPANQTDTVTVLLVLSKRRSSPLALSLSATHNQSANITSTN